MCDRRPERTAPPAAPSAGPPPAAPLRPPAWLFLVLATSSLSQQNGCLPNACSGSSGRALPREVKPVLLTRGDHPRAVGPEIRVARRPRLMRRQRSRFPDPRRQPMILDLFRVTGRAAVVTG